ncbi:hypothetical protein Cob_v011186 [Colletotrichum orbiculare MAFF 240422]|uniref:Uncharacterized protein n=1 Tax=Colletotrichum orbiculare (strain 104-T / ATCC 96160 / CBS 514.97 / LARS 414 / MAFF 240422) TaxID=1213857 RepID=A0A484FCN3_COLOR|nr:hypothetical protein Cob_v011186 [Colletotrichum orbiculare MAFF 240422]
MRTSESIAARSSYFSLCSIGEKSEALQIIRGGQPLGSPASVTLTSPRNRAAFVGQADHRVEQAQRPAILAVRDAQSCRAAGLQHMVWFTDEALSTAKFATGALPQLFNGPGKHVSRD